MVRLLLIIISIALFSCVDNNKGQNNTLHKTDSDSLAFNVYCENISPKDFYALSHYRGGSRFKKTEDDTTYNCFIEYYFFIDSLSWLLPDPVENSGGWEYMIQDDSDTLFIDEVSEREKVYRKSIVNIVRIYNKNIPEMSDIIRIKLLEVRLVLKKYDIHFFSGKSKFVHILHRGKSIIVPIADLNLSSQSSLKDTNLFIRVNKVYMKR